jgi:Dynamin family
VARHTPLAIEPHHTRRPEPVDTAALAALAALASELDAPGLATEARTAAERLVAGRFYVACVGQFKRGKSTLLNALVGRPLLPVGVTPVTAVVTVLRYGERDGARIRFADRDWRDIRTDLLVGYVSELHNSENKIGVAAVEVFVPSPLLASGMCLVDTPGIGSVFDGNTQATRAFVPHVDAALVVLGADPPISGEELALVADVARQVPELVFVLNKADRLSDAEREEAARFTEGILAERLGRPVPRLLHVSATEQLAGNGPGRDWPALQHALERLARDAGAGLLHAAERREAGRLTKRLLAEEEEQRGALARPREESDRRIANLSSSLRDAERAMADLGYLLQAEVDRLTRRFEEGRARFLAEVVPAARTELRRAIDTLPDRGLRTSAHENARQLAHARLDAWIAQEAPAAEHLYREASTRFVALANEFLARFLGSGEVGLSSLPEALGSEAGFRERSHLYFTELLAATAPSPLAWLLDRLRSTAGLHRAVRADADRVLERLLSSNSSRFQYDLTERVRESRRKLEAEIRGRLAEALRSATAALWRAEARQAAGEESVRGEIERLDSIRARLLALRPEGQA